MSIKAMSLVWELKCPAEWNGLRFTSSHKFVLLAYADHADHEGKSIYPAIITIRNKTGYSTERQIQRITHQLEQMGMLLPDGAGPKGTHRWMLPFDVGGVKITPPQLLQGDIGDQSLGDIPLGDIPSGVKITPELKEPEQEVYISILEKNFQFHDFWKKLKWEIRNASFQIDGKTMIITGLGTRAEVLQARYINYIKRALVISQDLESIIFQE